MCTLFLAFAEASNLSTLKRLFNDDQSKAYMVKGQPLLDEQGNFQLCWRFTVLFVRKEYCVSKRFSKEAKASSDGLVSYIDFLPIKNLIDFYFYCIFIFVLLHFLLILFLFICFICLIKFVSMNQFF